MNPLKISSSGAMRLFFSIILLLCSLHMLYAQAPVPRWQWARGLGTNSEDEVRGGLHLDSAGNAYQGMVFSGTSLTIGGQTYINRSFGGNLGFMFSYVKYNPQGVLLWAKTTMQDYTVSSRIPHSMFVSPQGYSYLLYDFYDSLKLSGLILRDTTIHSGYCIAVYDPDGNVVSLKAKKAKSDVYINNFSYYDESHILTWGNGFVTDTLDGHIILPGTFVAVMDTSGRILRLRNLGYDTLNSGGIGPIGFTGSSGYSGSNRLCTNTQKSIYFTLYTSQRTWLDSSLHITGLPALDLFGHTNLIMKFDSALDFKWSRVNSNYGITGQGIIASDPADHLYVISGGGSEATLSIGNLITILPQLSNLQFVVSVAKLDGNGTGMWMDTFVNGYGNRIRVSDMCTDKTGNVYIYGMYDSQFDLGPYSLTSYGETYVAKINTTGAVQWAQTSRNAQGNTLPAGMAEDGHGTLYINGNFGTSIHPFYGPDSLAYHTPLANHPFAADIFLAKLGTCNPAVPSLSAASALHWCGDDSVRLTGGTAASHYWSSGDTSRSIVVRSSGLYSVYAIDTLGCYARSPIDTVVAYTQPVLDAVVSHEVSCKNGSDGKIELHTALANGPVSYTYLPFISDTMHVAAGHYTIMATDTAHCIAYDSLVVTEPAAALEIRTDSLPASGTGTGVAVVTVTGGTPAYTYLWSNTSVTDTIVRLSSGWYAVTVTDHNGCQQSDSVYIRLILGIEHIADMNLTLYPNPSQGTLCINSGGNADMIIYDDAGRAIQQYAITAGANNIDMHTLTDGIYIIVMKHGIHTYRSKIVLAK